MATVAAFAVLGVAGGPGGTPESAGASVASVPKPPKPSGDGPGAEQYRPIVDGAVAQLAAKLGVAPLSPAPIIEPLAKKLAGGGKYAHAWAYGDPVDTCLIQIQPDGQKLGSTDLSFALTHEVVHCYQSRETNDTDVTDWVEEGAAMWAGATLVPGSQLTEQRWGPYLSNPTKSLFQRSYDGIGFFGHLEDVGIDVWPRILPMMLAETDTAAFEIGVAGSTAALDDWPAGLAREPAFGAAWDTSGPDIVATKPPRLAKSVTNGKSFAVSVNKAANAVVDLDVKADVLTIDAGANTHGRVRDANGSDALLSAVSGRPYCALPGGCVCPEGSPGAGIDLPAFAAGSAVLGATGGVHATKVAVGGRSLEDFCGKPGKVDPCLVGTWTSSAIEIDVPGFASGTGGAGGTLTIGKGGGTSIALDGSAPVVVQVEGLTETFTMMGGVTGIVNASKGVMTSLQTGPSTLTMHVVVPGLLDSTIPFTEGPTGTPFDGLYSCSKTTLTYNAPATGGKSTWKRA